MNYGQVKNRTLQLLNQYTIAGTQVLASYNNQADYLARIPGLVNDAMMEISTTARKIPTVLCLKDMRGETHGDTIRYELPGNFYQMVSGDVVTTTDGHTLHTNNYSVQGHRYLVIPKDEDGDYEITYYRYPNHLSDRPRDTDELDNEPDAHSAIPYYVASFLVADDNAYLCALFYNKFEDKLAKMGPGVTAEVSQVQDNYGFFG